MERDYVEDVKDDSWALHSAVSPEMPHGDAISTSETSCVPGREYSRGMLSDSYGESGWILCYHEDDPACWCAVDLEHG